MFYQFIRFFVFLLPPEFSHHFALRVLKFLDYFRLIKSKKIKNESNVIINGLAFKNRVGLAAGFDKNAEHINILEKLGFGFLELGTVTPKSQPGNVKPRIFRDVSNNALINSFGFNNVGIKKFISNYKKSNKNIILGINIGKNAKTPYKKSINDYVACLQKVYVLADYLTINISSPNTRNLRNLHDVNDLEIFLKVISEKKKSLILASRKTTPIYLKLSPDIKSNEIKPIISLLIKYGIDGVILANTTINKHNISQKYRSLPGGVSGAPLKLQAEKLLLQDKKISKNKLTIISVGGILSADDAYKRIKMGADLVQIYTGLIYKGPTLINEIRQKI
jgi:dihydroorotate dehydrogenase